jgi:hypothetical protein
VPHELAGRRDHVGDRQAGIDAHRQRVALLACAQHVRKDARTEPIAGKLLEQQRRRVLGARRHVGDGRELLVRIDLGLDALELTCAFDQLEPFAQVAPADPRPIGDVRRRVRPIEDQVFHCKPSRSQRS